MSRAHFWSIGVAVVLLSAGVIFYRITNARRHSQAVELAVEAMQSERLDEAISLLNVALGHRPGDPQARYLIAQAHQRRGDLDAALAQLRLVPLNDATAEIVLVQTAGVLITLNRLGEAEAVLRDCLRRSPESVAARQYLLDILGLQLRHREMRALLDELWKLAQTRPVLDRIWVLAKSFNVHFIKFDEEVVWPTLQACNRQEPDNLQTQIAMAKLRVLLNTDIDDAVRSLEQCLERSPNNLEVLATLASHYVEHGGEEERVDKLLRQWSAVSQDAQYFETLADWQTRQGMLQDALRSYERATELDPSQWRTLHKMGLLSIRLAKESADGLLEKEGEKLLESAAALKEARADSSRHFRFLQDWLNNQARGDRLESKAPSSSELVEIAAYCESVRAYTDALRWCDLVHELAPGDPTTASIRSRLSRLTTTKLKSGFRDH